MELKTNQIQLKLFLTESFRISSAKIATYQYPVRTSAKIAKLLAKIIEHQTLFEENKQSLISETCARDDSGTLLEPIDGKLQFKDDEAREHFESSMRNLLTLPIEIELLPIEAIDGCDIAPDAIAPLLGTLFYD